MSKEGKVEKLCSKGDIFEAGKKKKEREREEEGDTYAEEKRISVRPRTEGTRNWKLTNR